MIQKLFKNVLVWPIILCVLFFTAFSVLSIVRHNHYQSFGYDLGINDQVVWRYAHFEPPVSSIDPNPNQPKFAEHVELVYALVAPFYWIDSSPITLILVRNGWFCLSALAVFLLAKKYKLNLFLSLALVISYLGFYGVQNALWTDVHSNSFAAASIMWFIYFLETRQKKLSILFFISALIAKENAGVSTFLIAFIYFFRYRTKLPIFFMVASVLYVAFIFFVFFPYIMHVQYLYANKAGLLSNFNPMSYIDTDEKRQVILYSFLSFGFLPLLSPLYLLPVLGSLTMYFVIASDLSGAQGLYGHYRIILSIFLTFATMQTLVKFKWLQKWYIGLYLIAFTLLVQYMLHLPLSYLSKEWFWTQPTSVSTINAVIHNDLPSNASVVSQNNITPHISQRDKIYTLYPEKHTFMHHSPCGQQLCDWFRWTGSPEYLIVDTSSDWDIRHLLVDRRLFLNGLKNIEKAGIVTKYKQEGATILYKVNKNPESFK